MGFRMSGKLAYITALMMVASLTGSACAMNSPSSQLVDCRVVDGDRLPAETGGPEALCAAIKRAATAEAPARKFSVEVRVLGSSSLAATLTTADGTVLPEQKFAISDRRLTKGSLERFAKALVGEVARSSSP